MSLSTASVSIRAHAKINLDLRVLGMRADGFHELRTVFQAIALHDTIAALRERVHSPSNAAPPVCRSITRI
jgi:4-diphosphocytidyl-2-C-methyl-D-erythritol kinase